MNTRLIIINLVMLACIAGAVSAVNSGDDVGHAVLYENKYVDNNPMLTFPDPATYGYVIAYVRAGGSAQDLTVWVINDVANQTFDSYFHFDQTPVVGQNPMFEKLEVLPDGVSKPKSFPAGSYTAYLQRGNGDQLETVHFKIGGGATERITFLGAAVSSKHFSEDVLKIVEAKYGMGQTCNPTWIEEVNHTEYRYWIIGSAEIPAWIEHLGSYDAQGNFVGLGEGDYTRSGSGVNDPYVLTYIEPVDHPATYKTVCHDEVNHTVHHDAIPASGRLAEWTLSLFDYEVGHVHARENGNPSQTDFWYNNHRYHITGNSHDTAFIVTPGNPAWDEIVVDQPAYCEQVIDQQAWTEHFGDYNAEGVYVGAGNGDYTRSGTGIVDPYVYTYIEPIVHPAIPEGQGYWSEWSRTQDGGDVTYETRIVVDEPAHAGEPVCDGGNYIDVTAIVQNLVSGGQLHIAADYPNQHYNALFTDPCPGIFKELIVKYQINGGAVQTKTVAEDVDINIP